MQRPLACRRLQQLHSQRHQLYVKRYFCIHSLCLDQLTGSAQRRQFAEQDFAKDDARLSRSAATLGRQARPPRSAATLGRHARPPRSAATLGRHARPPRSAATLGRQARPPRSAATFIDVCRQTHPSPVQWLAQ